MLPAGRFVAVFAASILGFPISTLAQIGSTPEALFGAQGLALGRSAVIAPHDALAFSWNPAGITAMKRMTASAAWGSLVAAGASHTAFGLVIPTNRYGHLGVSFFQTRIGFTRRDDVGQEIGKGTDSQRHLLFTYGKNFSAAFAVGVNVKFVDQDFAGQSMAVENPGVDLGLSYRFQSSPVLLRNLVVGIAVDNFVKTSLKVGQLRETAPREARFIAAKSLTLGENRLMLVGNVGFLEYYFNQHQTRFHGGVEYSHQSTIALRAGLDDSQFSAGAGLQFKGARLDYARNYMQIASENFSPATNTVTLACQF
jgi:hypothetical protein